MDKYPPDMTRPLPRIAYLTGQYPEVSLTFILREVEGLRALGAEVLTCSIRETPAVQHPGPAEKEAAASTFHVLEDGAQSADLSGGTRPRCCAILRAISGRWRWRCAPDHRGSGRFSTS